MIHVDGHWFKDDAGRTLILRGINLSGSSKVPAVPDGATHIRKHFFEDRAVSFVGRPFPLDEADEHFTRLRSWGFTLLRFLITWEAIEHAGPGIYDEEYLDYLHAVVRKAGEYGINLFIDPHQDVWSRFSGGDGAPGWTLDAVGMDVKRFKETGAAVVHATYAGPLPKMIWGTNYGKFATATMFTLFFGGNDFAPETTVEGEPVQEYLQRHYIDAVKQVARRLKGLPNVVGYDTLNEPSAGFIGEGDLHAPFNPLLKGPSPTILQAMALASGHPQEVEVWDLTLAGQRKVSSRLLNPEGASLWMEGYAPIWRENGVWAPDAEGEPKALRPDHFVRVGERQVDFYRDYFRPFIDRYTREIHEIEPRAIVFVEGVPEKGHLRWTGGDLPGMVHAAHWYDYTTLITKNFVPWLAWDYRTMQPILGREQVLEALVEQVAEIKALSREMGDVPTLIGEFGVPFDMKGGEILRTEDFSLPAMALDASFRAIEANLVSSTLWNYTPDNTNLHGDQWNEENLSIFSRDQQHDLQDVNSGGRALRAAVRPYARAVAGEPLRMAFDPDERRFEFEFRHDPTVTAPTEIFVPAVQYPSGYEVEVSDGRYEIDRDAQTLIYHHTIARDRHELRMWDPVHTTLLRAREKRVRRATAAVVASALLAGGLVLWRKLTRQDSD